MSVFGVGLGRRALGAAFLLVSAPTVCAGQGKGTTLTVDGDTVTIRRDRYGVPHVFAGTARGLSFGNGYAVAEDRLAQMELYRRSAKGEMAALVGPAAVSADRETRIDGYTEAERQAQFGRMPADLQVMFQGYADGVTARIEAAKAEGKAIPAANYPTQGRSGLDPASLRSWTVTDSLAIGQMMARRFGGDEGGELRNLLVLNILKARSKDTAYRLFNDALWRNDPASPTSIPAGADGKAWSGKPHWATPAGAVIGLGASERARRHARLARSRMDLADLAAVRAAADLCGQKARLALAQRYGLMTKLGSYCMVVGAAKSAGGAALLVGGPQMGFRTPQIAHEIHLAGGGIDCIGMGFAGIPGVLIGHNKRLAWSTTTGVNDQTDIFVETLSPDNPEQYRFEGQWRPMEKRTEVIAVAGAPFVTIEVFRTVHGPVVQWDKAHHLAYARKASYWGREMDTFRALRGFMAARNVQEFGASCAHVATSHNWFCATQDGDIGYWFTGYTPIRAPGIDPRLPTPGDGSKEWRGILPFARMPQIVNPKQGFVANWNNKPAIWWDNHDTPVWGEVFHNGRIAQLLSAKSTVSAEDLRNILIDIGTNDYAAQVMLPLLGGALSRAGGILPADARRAARYLMAWDHHATEGSVAKSIFDAWVDQLREELFQKPFGFIRLQGREMFSLAMQPSLIVHVLRGPKSGVPVQHNYLGARTPDSVMLKALEGAVKALAKARGADPGVWRYSRGSINFSPLPSIPATDRGTYIQIVECARPALRGVNILPPGQSELVSSPHFADQRELAGWFHFKPMLTEIGEIERRP